MLNSNIIGVIKAYDLEGNKLWETEINSDISDGRLLFHKLQQKNDKLIVGGWAVTSNYIDAIFVSINEENGELIWKLTEDVFFEGDDVNGIHIYDNRDILISGTTGLADAGGFERAYLMKINDIPNSILDSKNNDIKSTPTLPALSSP